MSMHPSRCETSEHFGSGGTEKVVPLSAKYHPDYTGREHPVPCACSRCGCKPVDLRVLEWCEAHSFRRQALVSASENFEPEFQFQFQNQNYIITATDMLLLVFDVLVHERHSRE